MKKNMGNTDRLIRLLIFVVIGILYFTNVISGTLAIVLGVVALVALLTSLLSFCGLYSIFGWSTCKTKSKESA